MTGHGTNKFWDFVGGVAKARNSIAAGYAIADSMKMITLERPPGGGPNFLLLLSWLGCMDNCMYLQYGLFLDLPTKW